MPESVIALISDHVDPEHRVALVTRFPAVSFVPLPNSGEVPPEGRGAQVLLRAALTREALARTMAEAPELRWIHTSTAGFDWLLIPDVIEAIENGRLVVTRSAASYSVAIGEFVVGAMFLLLKDFPAFAAAQRERRWASLEPRELAGLTVGLVGAGAIGSEVARRARALGMRAIGSKRSPEPLLDFDRVLAPTQLGELLNEADVVVLAAPLTPETRGMIDEDALLAMKESAYLINVGRGALLQEAALIRALHEGWIAGALLDVFEQEPLPPESPLWELPNLVLTPHTSFRSPRNLERVLTEFSDNLRRYLAGEPLANTLRDPVLGY